MADLFETTVNFGLGLFEYTREKVEALVEEMVKKGEVHHKDAQGLVADLIKKGDSQRTEIERMVRGEVEKALGKTADTLHFARREDVLTADEVRRIIREEIAASRPKAAAKPKKTASPKKE